MKGERDFLSALGPMLRVRPELQDFCRFGGDWRAVHDAEERGWAAFHVVTRGSCVVERAGEAPVRLSAGDVLLLPHGDGHVVYGGGGRHEFREISYTYRDYIRIKRTEGSEIETELVCGRLHLEGVGENLLLRTLPHAILLGLGGSDACSALVRIMREELDGDRPGAPAIASDLASALFVILLRHYFEIDAAAAGVLALLNARESGRAMAAMVRDPAKDWGLDELASIALVSRATLVRAFRRFSGMAPREFLAELRLGIARNRLAHSSDSIARIAAEVGYQSEAAFSRAFNRRFGVRPGAARSPEAAVRMSVSTG